MNTTGHYLAKRTLFQLLFTLLALFFFSCQNPFSEIDESKVFRYNEPAGILTLDPAFAKDQSIIWACSQLYNGLVQFDEQLGVCPSIAKSWSLSDEGRTYRFILRGDVYFHDHFIFEGKKRRVVASDFVYSFLRILDEKLASPAIWIFADLDTVNARPAIWAESDSVLCLRIKKAFPPFLSLLAMPYCSVVAPEVVAYYGKEYRTHPIGTGPFYCKFWKEGVKMVLRKNKDYFERDEEGNRLPYLEAVSISFIVDKQTAFLEFSKGHLDFMNSIDPGFKDELLSTDGQLREKYASRIQMQSQPYLNTEYLGFLCDASEGAPFREVKVRQALNYAFDRGKMIRYLRNNIGTPGYYGIVPPGMPSFDSLGGRQYRYDPLKAQQLLAEAGYPNGQGLPVLQLSTTQTYLDLCKFIQQQLGLLGIRVRVDVNPPAALREQIAQAKLSWFRASWIADYPDAENYLSLFYSKNKAPQGPNYTRFSSKQFDELYSKSRTQTVDSVRFLQYRAMDSLLREEAPFMILYYDQVVRFTHKNLTGFPTNPMNLLILKHVRKAV